MRRVHTSAETAAKEWRCQRAHYNDTSKEVAHALIPTLRTLKNPDAHHHHDRAKYDPRVLPQMLRTHLCLCLIRSVHLTPAIQLQSVAAEHGGNKLPPRAGGGALSAAMAC